MQPSRINDLMNQLGSFALGFEPFFSDLTRNTTYPPHNIVSVSDDSMRLDMAVAGFKKNEITITEDRGTLTITGNHEKDETVFIYRGIGARSFTKTFKIADMYDITNTQLADGILSITLTKRPPEKPTARVIDID